MKRFILIGTFTILLSVSCSHVQKIRTVASTDSEPSLEDMLGVSKSLGLKDKCISYLNFRLPNDYNGALLRAKSFSFRMVYDSSTGQLGPAGYFELTKMKDKEGDKFHLHLIAQTREEADLVFPVEKSINDSLEEHFKTSLKVEISNYDALTGQFNKSLSPTIERLDVTVTGKLPKDSWELKTKSSWEWNEWRDCDYASDAMF